MVIDNMDIAFSNGLLVLSNECQTVTISLQVKPIGLRDINRLEDENGENRSDSGCDTNDGNTPVVSSCFSPCGKLFVCCCHKLLTLWQVDEWKLIGKKIIQRSANKVIFSPSNNILVADKSGDVYLHLLNDFSSPGTLLLGHLSMLLDILVTSDEKYIITCDRDEKIRISLFAKPFIIHSYCLGHEDFVTTIKLLPNDPSVLLSCGGDGSIRLWDYGTGKELLCHSLLKEDSSKEDLTEWKDLTPIIIYKAFVSQNETDTVHLFSLVFKVNAVWIHEIQRINSKLSCNLKQILKTDSEPICFVVLDFDKSLLVLQKDENIPLLKFEIISGVYKKSNSDCVIMKDVLENLKKMPDLFKNMDMNERFINSLIKKRFDNEGEYYKRKQERLERQNVKRIAT